MSFRANSNRSYFFIFFFLTLVYRFETIKMEMELITNYTLSEWNKILQLKESNKTSLDFIKV